MERLSVAEAARRLGVSPEAIRKRIKRGTIDHDQDPGGLTHVYVEVDNPVGNPSGDAVGNPDSPALISQMQARIDSLERQLEEANTRDRENRRLLAAALEMRQLEGRGDPDRTYNAEEPPASAEGSNRSPNWRSWWRGLFGR